VCVCVCVCVCVRERERERHVSSVCITVHAQRERICIARKRSSRSQIIMVPTKGATEHKRICGQVRAALCAPCAALSVQVLDISGTSESDINAAKQMDIHKQRLDFSGELPGRVWVSTCRTCAWCLHAVRVHGVYMPYVCMKACE
jgi:hypothetical protein